MDDATAFAMDQLFKAKWNIPQACQHMGLTNGETEWEETKLLFREYCINRTIEYAGEH